MHEYTPSFVPVWMWHELAVMIRHYDFVEADNVSCLCAVWTDNWPWQLTGPRECKMLARIGA